MKPIHLLQTTAVITGLLVTSCSLPKMAQQSDQDDVYVTKAEVITYTPAPEPVRQSPSNQSSGNYSDYDYDPYYGTSDPYYGMDYANRINNFYQGGLWRPYYDNYYASSFMPWYSPSLSFSLFYGSPFGYYSPWLSSYRFGYFNRFAPFWGGMGYPYYIGGGYYGSGLITGRPIFNPNYGPRPIRGREGISGSYPSNGVYPQRPGTAQQGRPGSVQQGRPAQSGRPGDVSTTPRPPRENTAPRPERVERVERPTYTPPPSTNSGGRTSSEGSGGGRPGRG